MSFLFISLSLFVAFLPVNLSNLQAGEAHHLRSSDNMKAGRQLEWVYNQEVICNNDWADYYDWEIPDDWSGGDSEDEIFDSDVCFDGSTYKRKHCLKPPDCRAEKGFPWPLKLCLNRVPIPGDEEKFYIAIMKCIPVWENCDKCVCGQMRKKRKVCNYNKRSEGPDDDRIEMDCVDVEYFFSTADQAADGSKCRVQDSLGVSDRSGSVLCPGSCGNKWNDWWEDITSCQKKNWEILGYRQGSWDYGEEVPRSSDICFDKLDNFRPGAKQAAINLCYREQSWNENLGLNC